VFTVDEIVIAIAIVLTGVGQIIDEDRWNLQIGKMAVVISDGFVNAHSCFLY
jgi:hypothetical protein